MSSVWRSRLVALTLFSVLLWFTVAEESDLENVVTRITAETPSSVGYDVEQTERLRLLLVEVKYSWETLPVQSQAKFAEYVYANVDALSKSFPEVFDEYNKIRLGFSLDGPGEHGLDLEELFAKTNIKLTNKDLEEAVMENHFARVDVDEEMEQKFEDAKEALVYGRRDEAVKLFRESAKEGHDASLTTLALMHLSGYHRQIRQDIPKGAELLRQAMSLGNPDAHAMAAMLHASGFAEELFPMDKTKEMLYLDVAAKGNSPYALAALGYKTMYGLDVKEDCWEAALYYEKASGLILDDADRFEFREQYTDLDNLYLDDGVDFLTWDEQLEYLHFLKGRAEQGNTDDQYRVASILMYGVDGVPRDIETSVKYFQNAAAAGNVNAVAKLGYVYYVAGDELHETEELADEMAVKQFKKAAEKGDTYGTYALGICYARGIGVKQDYKSAFRYFELAYSKGHVEAGYNLGLMRWLGLPGIKRDVKRAEAWFRDGAGRNHLYSAYQLGRLAKYDSCGEAVDSFKKVIEFMLLGPIQSHATDAFSRREYKPALYRFIQSAFMGSKPAQYNAAFMIERKMGVDGSMVGNESEIAFQLYQQAENQKLSIATMRLADMMYKHGAYEQASEAYRKASLAKLPEAQFNLGVMHMTGKGLAMDYHMAKRNFDLAAQSEDGYIPSAIALWALRFCTPRQELCTLVFDVAYVMRGQMSYKELEIPEKQVFQRLFW
eukprot:CAMPEP_0184745826 /NCGR_PEP_ID=MMETSP0315-20130426/8504_1 /TAXON_ID=101924 /ORGANISM="Rhodosorus marinus, Strain UTEX LB 2760" /LENGTH=719 /DNA_ID=CAMNT_0027218191 /DNA_START=160 /DNA_END=2316 /DNA_ORIENTATION=+